MAFNDPGLRHRSLAEATRRGIDLERLKTAQNRLHSDFDQLFNRRNSFSSSNVTVRELDARFAWPPMLPPEDPDVGTVYIPPFGEPWDRSEVSEASGDGRVMENRSYLSFPGTVVQVQPGERRSLNLFTDVAFPGGKTVWVYVAIADYIQAHLSDVSIDISLDSAWQLTSLAVSAP